MDRLSRFARSRDARPRPAEVPAWYAVATGRRDPGAFGEALLVLAACITVAAALRDLLPATSIPYLFLLGVLAVAVRRGLHAALFTSVLSYATIRFFFGAPFLDFGVSDTETYLAITTFFVVSLVVGSIAAQLREQLADAEEQARRVTLLYDLSRRLTAVSSIDELTRTVTECAEEACKRAALVMLRTDDDRLIEAASDGAREGTLGAGDLAAARAALDQGVVTGADTAWHPGSPWRFLPIVTEVPGHSPRVLGVLAVRRSQARSVAKADAEDRLLNAMRDQAAIALERLQLAQQRERARMLEESERLRTALLASVSHDLRTPLASIIGASSSLQELGDALGAASRHELLDTVLGEAERLDRFVQNLLDMTRIEHGAIEPKRQWCDLHDAVGDALRHLRRTLGEHRVAVDAPADLPLVHTDPVLLDHVLVNLVDNARKFSPPGAPIALGIAVVAGGAVEIAVEDQGPGIPEPERERIFGMFKRLEGSDAKITGTGLGLAICRGFVGALGGRLVAGEGRGGRGTRMLVTLPPSPQPELPGSEDGGA